MYNRSSSYLRRRLYVPHDISKTDAARIIKLDIKTFQDESSKPVHFRVKRSKVKVSSLYSFEC